MEWLRVLLVFTPVGVGLLDDDLALLHQALEDLVDVEIAAPVFEADGQVLEVYEYGQGAVGLGHVCSVLLPESDTRISGTGISFSG